MEGDKKGEDKYRMTAIINGEAITHEIKQKDYDKFLAVDDYHRMKLFSKVFSEVDMKTRPETNAGLGTKILAALTAGAVVTAEVAHDMKPPSSPSSPGVRMPSIMVVHVLTSNLVWIHHRRLRQGTLRQKPIMLLRRLDEDISPKAKLSGTVALYTTTLTTKDNKTARRYG